MMAFIHNLQQKQKQKTLESQYFNTSCFLLDFYYHVSNHVLLNEREEEIFWFRPVEPKHSL